MTINVTVLPESGGAPAPVRTAQPVLSAAGVNDLGALARQQLLNAVPAPALIPGYAANIASPPKPPVKPSATTASSALAAQVIAQSPGLAAEDLALFTPRAPSLTTAEYVAQGDDFLAAMRVARGDVPAVPEAATKAVDTRAVMQQTATATATALAPLAAGLPAVLTQFVRQLNLSQARGVSAYQLSELRNAAMRKAAVSAS